MIVLYFIGFFIKLKSSYNVNNKQLEIIISYVLVILTIVQATIQVFIYKLSYIIFFNMKKKKKKKKKKKNIYIYIYMCIKVIY